MFIVTSLAGKRGRRLGRNKAGTDTSNIIATMPRLFQRPGKSSSIR